MPGPTKNKLQNHRNTLRSARGLLGGSDLKSPLSSFTFRENIKIKKKSTTPRKPRIVSLSHALGGKSDSFKEELMARTSAGCDHLCRRLKDPLPTEKSQARAHHKSSSRAPVHLAVDQQRFCVIENKRRPTASHAAHKLHPSLTFLDSRSHQRHTSWQEVERRERQHDASWEL